MAAFARIPKKGQQAFDAFLLNSGGFSEDLAFRADESGR
jgi:hypothetical protein